MLHPTHEKRKYRSNQVLACFAASIAGMANIAGVMAFYAFTSNVTGHAVNFANHMVTGNYFEMFVVMSWLLAFMLGAGLAHFLITSYEDRGLYVAHSVPILVVFLLLIFTAIFGHYFHENSSKDILIVSIALLLAMGMLNSTVNTF